MNFWLFKSEPDTFGVDDLARAPASTTAWDGVRNYQVRNMLRDQVCKGDRGFFYHSSCDEPGIAGIVKVVRAGYPEAAALDRRHRYYDPKSDPASPTWYSVDVKLERRIDPVIGLETPVAGCSAGRAAASASVWPSIVPSRAIAPWPGLRSGSGCRARWHGWAGCGRRFSSPTPNATAR